MLFVSFYFVSAKRKALCRLDNQQRASINAVPPLFTSTFRSLFNPVTGMSREHLLLFCDYQHCIASTTALHHQFITHSASRFQSYLPNPFLQGTLQPMSSSLCQGVICTPLCHYLCLSINIVNLEWFVNLFL